jgi:hypothetical protein
MNTILGACPSAGGMPNMGIVLRETSAYTHIQKGGG